MYSYIYIFMLYIHGNTKEVRSHPYTETRDITSSTIQYTFCNINTRATGGGVYGGTEIDGGLQIWSVGGGFGVVVDRSDSKIW